MIYKIVLAAAIFLQWHGFSDSGNASNSRRQTESLGTSASRGRRQTGFVRHLDGTRPQFNVAQSLKAGDSVPFQPWAKAVFDERQANHSKDDPSARCLPAGLTPRATLATPLKIVQIAGLTLILYKSRE